MSIYKFMAGIVDLESDSKTAIDLYDPHEHRIIHKPTSYLDTMTHLLKGSIGAGILAMPEATRRVGIVFHFGLLVVVGLFATYCIQLLIRAQYLICKRHHRGYMAYPKSMLFVVREGPPCMRWSGKFLYYFVDVVLLTWQLGIGTIYLIFIAENVNQVCAYHGTHISLRMLLVYLLVPTLALNLIKDLKMLSPLSSMSNVVTFIGLILVFFYLIEDDIDFDPAMLQIKSYDEIPHYIGTALFALEAVGVILALEYNMKHPKQFVGVCGLFNVGMCLIISLYLSVGMFGYLKYGDDIKASITLNLPSDQKKAQAAKIIFAVAIFLSFPLQNFVAYEICLRKCRKRITNERAKCPVDYLLRVVLVILPWLFAVAIPNLGPVISLFGAFCLSLLAMVFPALMNTCLLYGEPKGYGIMKYKLIRDILIIIIGVMILISGVIASISEF